MEPMSPSTQNLRYFALTANLSLLLWVALWQSVISPHPHLNNYIVAGMWILPLLLPMKGILEGKPYTHAWANFILMFYFLHALTLLWVDGGERWLALVELGLTTAAFFGNILFARARGRELGNKLKKLSQVEREEREAHGDQ
ncbi:DUF2069 domain-containing protein [Photobacterium galatheae]|uniref:Membrane protein n=1 Tax=Photobacterium galatheae TaxID=1654360 RepID=A0A066RU81_9GAMM|nr:DUF2069 domain-containing protein [Photobacterium galatheae]KDM91227.1 membrane protein [Photobacterium galatheae]MCM0148574.1 DUF2069 domain-containing protein [Photobacterium galatheae]